MLRIYYYFSVSYIFLFSFAISSGITPYALGSIYSWSLRNVEENPSNTSPMGFPLNQYLVFMLMAISTIFVLVIVVFIQVDNVASSSSTSQKTTDDATAPSTMAIRNVPQEHDFLASLNDSSRERLGSCTRAAELVWMWIYLLADGFTNQWSYICIYSSFNMWVFHLLWWGSSSAWPYKIHVFLLKDFVRVTRIDDSFHFLFIGHVFLIQFDLFIWYINGTILEA